MGKELYLTVAGATRLRAELEELKGSKRQELAERLRAAVQQGDLSENADYIATKEEQSFVEGRIQEIEFILKEATVIEESASTDGRVKIGSRVTIQEDGSAPEEYHVVGAAEANPRAGRISNESPIGAALIDHKEGDEVSVETPGGKIKFKIIRVE